MIVSTSIEQLRGRILRCLQQAQQNGELSAELSTDSLADFCLNGLHGALLRMKVNQSPAPFHAFLTILFDQVLTR